MNKYGYAAGKLFEAMECLSTHPGDARGRIIAAYNYLILLEEADFPENCREKWIFLKTEINKRGPFIGPSGEIWKGSAENTMIQSKNKTASKLCQLIFELYWSVSENEKFN